MLLGRKTNKALTILIIIGILFSLITYASVSVPASEGESPDISLLSGSTRCFICLPKETGMEMSNQKLHIHSVLWVHNNVELAIQNEAALDIAMCPKTYNSSKIVEVTYKKDGKK